MFKVGDLVYAHNSINQCVILDVYPNTYSYLIECDNGKDKISEIEGEHVWEYSFKGAFQALHFHHTGENFEDVYSKDERRDIYKVLESLEGAR